LRFLELEIMPRHRSTSPPWYQLGANRECMPVVGFGGGESGSGSGESGGLTIHRVTKEISSDATFPMLTKTNYHDWVTLM
jgi:hypothetical protein